MKEYNEALIYFGDVIKVKKSTNIYYNTIFCFYTTGDMDKGA